MSALDARMVMRAEVLRNGAAANSYGGRGKPEWNVVSDAAPCYVWSRVRNRYQEGRVLAEVEELGVIFRREADIQEGDRVSNIKDRRDRVLFAGPFEVLTGTEKSNGTGIDHLSFRLRRIA